MSIPARRHAEQSGRAHVPGYHVQGTLVLKQRTIDLAKQLAPDYVDRTFGEEGYDPILSLVATSVTTNDLGLRALCDREVAQYFYHKRSSVKLGMELEEDPAENEHRHALVHGILESLGKRPPAGGAGPGPGTQAPTGGSSGPPVDKKPPTDGETT